MQTIDHTKNQNGRFKFSVHVTRDNGSQIRYLEDSTADMREQVFAMQMIHPIVSVFDEFGNAVL